jgi:glycosyltransferase involved in cell wall biosynthesis
MNSASKKLLVFHTKVAPYRVDFFNNLALYFHMTMHIDKKKVYGALYSDLDVEKEYHFEYKEFSTTDGVVPTIRYVVSAIRRSDPDTIMVSECGLVSLIVVVYKYLHRKRYRVVSIIDDSFDMLTRDNQFSLRHEKAEKILVPRFDAVICVEPRVANFFKQNNGNGIYFPIIRDEVRYRSELTKSLGLARSYVEKYGLEGMKIILFVGRFVEYKNLTALIKAVQSISDDHVRLILVGAGPEEASYRRIADPARILFPGKMSGLELYAWYNVAQIFALPSVKEAFGAVVNEALMSGCKCLVSARAGSSCLVQDGCNGFSINPLDEQDIKRKLELLLQQVDYKQVADPVKPCLMPTTFKKEFKKVIEVI